jgi:hypothetical protein
MQQQQEGATQSCLMTLKTLAASTSTSTTNSRDNATSKHNSLNSCSELPHRKAELKGQALARSTCTHTTNCSHHATGRHNRLT